MSQSNFQLVIITHDEDFVDSLGKSDYADYYWRVSKTEELVFNLSFVPSFVDLLKMNSGHHSVILRQNIRDS